MFDGGCKLQIESRIFTPNLLETHQVVYFIAAIIVLWFYDYCGGYKFQVRNSRVYFSPENIDGRNLNEMHQCTNKILPRVFNVKIKL